MESHIKNIKLPDGRKVNIYVRISLSFLKPEYVVTVSVCDAGKRKFKPIDPSNNYSFRVLSLDDRQQYLMERYLEIVTAEQIHEAKLELWEKLKPTK